MAAQPEDRVRKIIHIDMDAFYAAVEQRDDPALRGKAIAVGRDRMRGVVATASYEARAFGVHSAMPSVTARHKCPGLIFVEPRFDVYKAVSRQIRGIFARVTPLIEPLSLDEAYLDVTDAAGETSATAIAEEIRAAIRAETGLTASAGVSYNKFLAKIASDYRKPDGMFVVTPQMGPAFVAALPVRKFHGIGPATAEKMLALGIATGGDLAARDLPFLTQRFGKAGAFYYWIARGIDGRPVRPDRERKSIGTETTFAADIASLDEARTALRPLAAKVWEHTRALRLSGRTATLKVKYADFRQITRSHTAPAAIASAAELESLGAALLAPLFPARKGIRLLGITLSSFEEETAPAPAQLRLAL
ncbi:DNA polymerase IV [Oleispirillum naphthae]|uniref:DNA polymerase IV n=1 Tax=Oleispirillum naphthae TaxID=2838853 RepID=UPI0030823B12